MGGALQLLLELRFLQQALPGLATGTMVSLFDGAAALLHQVTILGFLGINFWFSPDAKL